MLRYFGYPRYPDLPRCFATIWRRYSDSRSLSVLKLQCGQMNMSASSFVVGGGCGSVAGSSNGSVIGDGNCGSGFANTIALAVEVSRDIVVVAVSAC